MPIIKGFSTLNREEMIQKMKESNVTIKLPFKTEGSLKVTENPLEGMDIVNCEGEKQEIEIVNITANI